MSETVTTVHPTTQPGSPRAWWASAIALRCLVGAMVPVLVGMVALVGLTNAVFWWTAAALVVPVLCLGVVRRVNRAAWDRTPGADHVRRPGEPAPDLARADLVVPVWDLVMAVTALVLITMGAADASTWGERVGVDLAVMWAGAAAGAGVPLALARFRKPVPGPVTRAYRTVQLWTPGMLLGGGVVIALNHGRLAWILTGLIAGVTIWVVASTSRRS